MLWPIFHYRQDIAEFSIAIQAAISGSTNTWPAELHKILLPDDIILVHDYHLLPLAKAFAVSAITTGLDSFIISLFRRLRS